MLTLLASKNTTFYFRPSPWIFYFNSKSSSLYLHLQGEKNPFFATFNSKSIRKKEEKIKINMDDLDLLLNCKTKSNHQKNKRPIFQKRKEKETKINISKSDAFDFARYRKIKFTTSCIKKKKSSFPHHHQQQIKRKRLKR